MQWALSRRLFTLFMGKPRHALRAALRRACVGFSVLQIVFVLIGIMNAIKAGHIGQG